MHLIEIIPLVVQASNEKDLDPNRTQLQKLVYFAIDALGGKCIHRPHYYGPYSSVVSEVIHDLTDLNFLEEKLSVSFSARDDTEIRRYSYQTTDEGKVLVTDLKSEYPKEHASVRERISTLVNKFGLDTDGYACASKVHFILQRNHEIKVSDFNSIKKCAARLGWDLSVEQIQSAYTSLETMKLLPS